jgi:serine/threonine protein kinase
MDHPFISKLFDVIETDQFAYLVMEYAERGTILRYVNEYGRLPEVQARRYFSQLLSALEYLHDVRKVAHRDLKAENVLLDRHSNIRVIDFGLSNTFCENVGLGTACGSPAYAAPEMVQGKTYTKSVDIWSSGVLLYAMVVGHLPFDDENATRLLQKIAYSEPMYPAYMSPQLLDLLNKLLIKNPDERITIPRIKSHPWFSQSEYAKFLQFRFSTDEQWLVRGVDRKIVDQLTELGVDIKPLIHSLLMGEYTELTALYSLLRRYSLTDRIRDFMAALHDNVQPMPWNDSLMPLTSLAVPTRQYTHGTKGMHAPVLRQTLGEICKRPPLKPPPIPVSKLSKPAGTPTTVPAPEEEAPVVPPAAPAPTIRLLRPRALSTLKP